MACVPAIPRGMPGNTHLRVSCCEESGAEDAAWCWRKVWVPRVGVGGGAGGTAHKTLCAKMATDNLVRAKRLEKVFK